MNPYTSYVIGWDVGGWNCDKNPTSRDAIVILDTDLNIIGKPWRGNLRGTINDATTASAFIAKLFKLCAVEPPVDAPPITIAIDAALGYSESFVRLIQGSGAVGEPIGKSQTNPYLHRQSELRLFQFSHSPLSPVKDMIGSQSTKAIHVVSKFAPVVQQCGVWSDGIFLTMIEAYPSPCVHSATIAELLARVRGPHLDHVDKRDALTCALIAHLFVCFRELLDPPFTSVCSSEGWIWVPRDALKSNEG